MNQAKSPRGGGTGGFGKDESAENSAGEKAEVGAGEMSTNFSGAGGNSIFNVGETASDFFSDFFPAAMALHSGQGCLPSNVLETASVTDCVQRLFASIVVHATVCSAAQCAPVERTSAAITRNFPQRANTPSKSFFLARKSSLVQCSAIHTSVPLGSRSKSAIKSASARWMQPHEDGSPMDSWSPVPWM